MYHQSLSRDELDSLLQPVPEHQWSAESTQPDTAPVPSDLAIHELHRGLSVAIAKVLSNVARRNVSVSLRDAARGTFGQFVFGQPVPSCCGIVRADPIQAEFIVSIRTAILFPLLDLWLGCDSNEPIPHRPMTEIETQLAGAVLETLLETYREAWQRALALRLELLRFEHNPQRLETFPGGQACYLVRYDIDFAPHHGKLELCLPWSETQTMRERLVD